jgi:hypothetical protein
MQQDKMKFPIMRVSGFASSNTKTHRPVAIRPTITSGKVSLISKLHAVVQFAWHIKKPGVHKEGQTHPKNAVKKRDGPGYPLRRFVKRPGVFPALLKMMIHVGR